MATNNISVCCHYSWTEGKCRHFPDIKCNGQDEKDNCEKYHPVWVIVQRINGGDRCLL